MNITIVKYVNLKLVSMYVLTHITRINFLVLLVVKGYSKIVKVNSVEEACAKCFMVHISKFEIFQIT